MTEGTAAGDVSPGAHGRAFYDKHLRSYGSNNQVDAIDLEADKWLSRAGVALEPEASSKVKADAVRSASKTSA